MTQLIARTNISDTYPLPSNANAKLGLAAIWDVVNEMSQAAEIDVASAATVAIGAQTTRKLRITGTTGITSFGTTYTGIIVVRFAAALTITHNATTLICPNGVNLTVAAGDIIIASPKATTSGTFDGWIITAANSASEINSLPAKTTPVGGDLLAIIDSAAGNVLKKLSLTNLAAMCSAGWNAATATTCADETGIGQSWSDVTASRAVATRYTNSTAKPIHIFITVQVTAGQLANIKTNNEALIISQMQSNGAVALNDVLSAIIPPSGTYYLTLTGSIIQWIELR